MIVYNLTHYDLDGVVSSMVVEHAMEKFCDRFVAIPSTYENADTQLMNIAAMAKHAGDQFVVAITDLNLNTSFIEKVLNIADCKKVIYLDHHPRDGRGSLEKLKEDYGDHFVFRHTEEQCGATIALNFFDEAPLNFFNDDFRELVRLTNVYDMWQKDHPDFRSKAFGINDLFWSLKFDDFAEELYNGYILTDKHKAIIKEIDDKRVTYLADTEENHATAIPIGHDDSLLFVHNPAGDYINDMTLAFPTHQLYLIFKYQAKGLNIFSIRSADKKYNVTKLTAQLEEIIPNAEGGGHPAAGGISIPLETPMEEFFEKFIGRADNMGF